MEFKTEFNFKGFEKLLATMDKDLEKKVVKEVQDRTNTTETKAKSKVPVDTGLLKSSIHAEFNRNGQEIEGSVGTNVEYAPYIEFGTGERGIESNTNKEVSVNYKADWQGMKAQPFLFPAFNEERETFQTNMEKILKEVVK